MNLLGKYWVCQEWLWLTATQECCLFDPGDTRSRAKLIQQLGSSFDGVINSDDYSACNGYEVKAQQKCASSSVASLQKSREIEPWYSDCQGG
jgi:hypothetical protein